MKVSRFPLAKAYLYDCDGTLAISMKAHVNAWVQVLLAEGCPLSAKQIADHINFLAGMPAEEVIEKLNQQYSLQLPARQLSEKKENFFYEHLIHEVKPIELVVNHLIEFAPTTPVAVVSGGRKKTVEKTLEIIGVRQFFQVIIAAEDVQFGKPSPEGYLLAAKKLGVSAHDCLVFEDADLGIAAAKAAGMPFVRIEAE